MAGAMTRKTDVTLWLLIGLPGSGKSTWAEQFRAAEPPLQLISTDAIRRELFGDEATQGPWLAIWRRVVESFQQAVVQTQQQAFAGAVYDATNAQRRGRRTVMEAARQAGFNRLQAVWFDVPTAVCLERNRQRSRQVPVDVIETMARQLAGAPPHYEEGFEAVYRIGSTAFSRRNQGDGIEVGG